MLTKKILTAFLILITGLSAQTPPQWRISWDANSEPDMHQYWIYRSTNPNATTKIAEVDHPDTEYIDDNINKGQIYYYRLKAVDDTLNESGFSTEVSAAFPLLNFPGSTVTIPISNNNLNLGQYVNDPDHNDSNLSWVVENNPGGFNITIGSTTATISPVNAVSGTIQFRVTDPDGFYDVGSISITIDTTDTNPPPSTNQEIETYPMPYKLSGSSQLTFSNVPDGAKIYIYNLLGELVFKDENPDNPVYQWEVANSAGKLLAPGVYLYYIKAGSKTSSGKLVIKN
jgi:hypothetical protein